MPLPGSAAPRPGSAPATSTTPSKKADTSTRAQGRIVFIDQKTERTRDGRGYGAAVLARSAGAVEAAKRGAVALGIRSIGTSGGAAAPGPAPERIAHTGAMRYELGVARIPVPDADRIAALQLSQDGSAYFDVHHTVHDTLDKIDPATLAQNVACWAVCAWLAAQAPLAFGPPEM